MLFIIIYSVSQMDHLCMESVDNAFRTTKSQHPFFMRPW